MKEYLNVTLTAALMLGLCGVSAAQSAQPSQPVDPTAQAPTAQAPTSQAPSTTSPDTDATPKTIPGGTATTRASAPSSTPSKARPFMGTVVRRSEGFVLRAGDLEYKLDDQSQVEPYLGKSVKVMGNLDKKNNTIQVHSVEASPSM